MNTTKHTPGPWECSDMSGCDMQDNTYACFHIGISGGAIIADLQGSYEDHDRLLADARLIAAAPELLEACKEANRLLSGLLTDSQLDFKQPDGRNARDRAHIIKEAIAKATGTISITKIGKIK